MKPAFLMIFPAAALALLNGCSTPAGDVRARGFLGDYSMLRVDPRDRAALSYVNPSVNFAEYDSIMIDPVTVWRGPNSHIQEVSVSRLTQLSSYFWEALFREVGKTYRITRKADPRTMRLRVALTDVQPGPMGNTAAEGELTDSVSGKRLAAAVSERSGDPKAAVNYWAETFVEDLQVWRLGFRN